MEYMPDFKVVRPTSIEAAVKAHKDHPAGRCLAGGTDILVNVRRGIVYPVVLIELTDVTEMHGISQTDDGGLRLGAGVTLRELTEDDRVRSGYTAIAEAAGEVAATSHREVATLGGNLCLDTRCIFYNQSEWWRRSNDYCLKYRGDTCHVAPSGKTCFAAFSGDVAPAVLVHGGQVEIAGPNGNRHIPLNDLYQDDGLAHLTLSDGEIVVAVVLPPADESVSGYRKARVRGSIDFPLAGVAMALHMNNGTLSEIRVALTGTNSRPILLEGASDLRGSPVNEELRDRLVSLIPKQIQPMTSTFTPPGYRRKVVTNLTRALARQLAEPD